VLFADCRGYTRLTQELGIEKLAPITEEFFKTSAQIIRECHGIVDHLLGDAIMALFNVPIKHDDHVSRAVEVAIRIQDAVAHINAKLEGTVVLGGGHRHRDGDGARDQHGIDQLRRLHDGRRQHQHRLTAARKSRQR
jgi:class 3 adenylate cyclase